MAHLVISGVLWFIGFAALIVLAPAMAVMIAILAAGYYLFKNGASLFGSFRVKTSDEERTFDLTTVDPELYQYKPYTDESREGCLVVKDYTLAHAKRGDYVIMPNGVRTARYRVLESSVSLFSEKVTVELEFAPRINPDDTPKLKLPL